jgi:hypothetical protein
MQNLSLVRHYSARLAAGLLVMMLAPALAHTQAGFPNAGSEYFAEADKILSSNGNASTIGLVEKGWTAVRSAGPRGPGFLDGVYTAIRLFHVHGWDLRAESVYAESILACDGAALRPARLRLTYMFAQDLIGQKEYVKAESVLRSALQAEESSSEKSGLYVAFVQSLAFVREQEGDLEDAERLYRSTLMYGAPDLSGVVTDRVFFSPGPRLPMIGGPLDILADFLVNHGRLAEAEQLFRDQLMLAGHDPNWRLSALRQLSWFVAYHGSKTEAVALQEQILEQVKAAPRQSPELNYAVTAEQSTLARYEVDAGQKEEARQMLQTSLLEAQKNKGTGSPEYRSALADLFENRRYAGDYDMAENLAREQLQLAREGEKPGPIDVSSALSNLAMVRKSQGFEAEATELQKQASDAVRQTGPSRWWEIQARFAAAEEMIKEDNPGQAVAAIEEATTALSPFRQDELFSFFQVAQSFLTFQHKGEATRVAALAVSIVERQGANDPRWSYSLVNWANFYRGQLDDRETAAALLDKAERLIRACCGEKSPRLEPLLRERAWMQAAGGNETQIAGLEHLRDFQISVYGGGNQAVEETTLQLAELHARLGKWDQAAGLYKKTLTMCARRTGGQGREYDSLLDRVLQQLRSYAGLRTTLEVKAPAKNQVASAARSEEAEPLPDKHRQILDILDQMSATPQQEKPPAS